MSLARWVADKLEQGALLPPALGRTLSTPYTCIAAGKLARPVSLPYGVPIIGVGSAVLGGAGKTPVAIAYAQTLAAQGLRVAFVAHGYRTKIPRPRTVHHPHDLAAGDDALCAARTLHPLAVPVWVGTNRNQTLHEAARNAHVIVVDGLLQTKPRPLTRSVLVVDREHPFGSGQCLPTGDLRAPFLDVLAQSDEVVVVADPRAGSRALPEQLTRLLAPERIRTAWLDLHGAWDGNRRLSLKALRQYRLGLATLIARPGRVRDSLLRRGIRPVCAWHGTDHGPLRWHEERHLRALAHKHRLHAWVVTQKCVTHMAGRSVGCQLFALEVTTRLDPTPRPVLDSRPCVPRESSCSC